MKKIISRNLPLDTKYTLIDKKYVPLLEGDVCICSNCNKLIANIATVRNEKGEVFNIGFDCLETLLINNNLLDKLGVDEYFRVKPMFMKAIRFSKTIKEVIENNKQKNINITGISFSKPKFKDSDWFEFYWLTNNEKDSRNNDSIKIKDMDFEILVDTIKNIFPNLLIITNNK